MAYIRASQGGGGSGDKGTLIWTNPNSTLTLATGLITLGSNLSNFSKIRVKWYVGGSSAVTRDEEKEVETIMPISIIPLNTALAGAPGLSGVTNTAIYRYFHHNSGDADNTVRTQCAQATACVPYKIYGII